MIRLINVVKQSLINPKIVHNAQEFKKDPLIKYYPIVGLKSTKLGSMRLNQPNNNNILNTQSIDEFYRFLLSYYHDHTVENVWIEHKGRSFSFGADYEELYHREQYIHKLYKLAILIAQFNKPIFYKLDGGVRGLASHFLTMFSTGFGTESSSFKLDEASRGFIPIGGGSHRITQLPYGFGLYLALTGKTIHMEELLHLNILSGCVDEETPNQEIRHGLSDANLYMRMPLNADSFGQSEFSREQKIRYKMANFDYRLQEIQKDIIQGTQHSLYGKFAFHQYNLALMNLQNAKNPFNAFSYKRGLKVNNYYSLRFQRPLQYLHEKGLISKKIKNKTHFRSHPLQKIMKIFNRNSLPKIIQALKEDGSEWAQQTYEKIMQNDPLAVQLTFNLINRAKDLSWSECIEMEYMVAKRLLKQSEFALRDDQMGNTKILKNSYSNSSLFDIPQEYINSFFAQVKNEDEKLIHELPAKALLPHKDFWREVPDSPWHFLNNTFFNDYYKIYQKKEVQRYLEMRKINHRDGNFSLDIVRQKLHEILSEDQKMENQKTRIKIVLQNKKMLKEYMNKKNQAITKHIKDPSLQQKVKNIVEAIVNEKFDERFSGLEKTVEAAGKERKMEIFRNYRKSLVENIVLNGENIEKQNLQRNKPYRGIISFDEEGKSIFEAKNIVEEPERVIDLKEQINKGSVGKLSLSEEFIEKHQDSEKRIASQIITKEEQIQISPEQQHFIERYDYSKERRQSVFYYQYMIRMCSQTSEEVASLLEWSEEDIQAMIDNSPPEEKSFIDYSSEVIERQNQIVKKRLQLFEGTNKFYQQWRHNLFPKEDRRPQKKSEIPFLFDIEGIPRPFRFTYMKLLDDIVYFFSQKYSGKFPKMKDNSYLNKIVEGSLATGFTEFLKHDIQYVFSYLAILHLKSIFQDIKQKRGLYAMPNPIRYFKVQYEFNFDGYDMEQVNRDFVEFLYTLTDMYSDAKQRIIMPQTKVLDFITRLKISQEYLSSNNRNVISFDSLMLLIAKDRKRIKNIEERRQPLLSSQPEYAMSLLQTQTKIVRDRYPKFDPKRKQIDAAAFKYSSNLKTYLDDHTKKRLNISFVHYLMQCDELFQRATGEDVFLPYEWRQFKPKEKSKLLENIFQFNLSDQEWFDANLQQVINLLFQYREGKQKGMTKGELILFDSQFKEVLNPECLEILLRFKLRQEEYIAQKILNGEENVNFNKQNQLYYYIKKNIKNKKALRILNNLILVDEIREERRKESNHLGEQDAQFSTSSAENKVLPQTVKRLVFDAIQYPEQEDYSRWQDSAHQRKIIGKKEKEELSAFMRQVSSLRDALGDNKVTKELGKQLDLLKTI